MHHLPTFPGRSWTFLHMAAGLAGLSLLSGCLSVPVAENSTDGRSKWTPEQVVRISSSCVPELLRPCPSTRTVASTRPVMLAGGWERGSNQPVMVSPNVIMMPQRVWRPLPPLPIVERVTPVYPFPAGGSEPDFMEEDYKPSRSATVPRMREVREEGLDIPGGEMPVSGLVEPFPQSFGGVDLPPAAGHAVAAPPVAAPPSAGYAVAAPPVAAQPAVGHAVAAPPAAGHAASAPPATLPSGTTPSLSGFGAADPEGKLFPSASPYAPGGWPAAGAGLAPPAAGAGVAPPIAGAGVTPPTAKAGVTPPTAKAGVTPSTAKAGVTPPTAKAGVTPPTAGPGVAPPTAKAGVVPPTAGPGVTPPTTKGKFGAGKDAAAPTPSHAKQGGTDGVEVVEDVGGKKEAKSPVPHAQHAPAREK
ncbi:MAG: hypothetical protein H7833_02615 [Magnetococcus sp. DMHC-1]